MRGEQNIVSVEDTLHVEWEWTGRTKSANMAQSIEFIANSIDYTGIAYAFVAVCNSKNAHMWNIITSRNVLVVTVSSLDMSDSW